MIRRPRETAQRIHYGHVALTCLLFACLVSILACPGTVTRLWMLLDGAR